MSDLPQHIVNGLALGSTYALIALGYTMVFGVLKLINFAHGEVYMLGAFAGYYFARTLGLDSAPSMGALGATVAAGMIACSAAGFLIERFAYRPLRKAPRINVLITAVGVSLLLQYSGQIIFGADPKFFPQVYQPSGDFSFAGVSVNPIQLAVFTISVGLMLLLQWIVFRTRLGRAMRAVSFNHELASLMGIPTNLIISATFVLGAALAGAAGVLVGLSYPKIDPLMGVMPGLKAFAAAVLGGVGNVIGAVVGALILGLAEQLLVACNLSTYRDALAFVILILILLFKPTGLFGAARTEKV